MLIFLSVFASWCRRGKILKYWSCFRFLCNQTKDADLRKWAAEGLAYLTLDADIKEELVDDVNAIKSLIELAKV